MILAGGRFPANRVEQSSLTLKTHHDDRLVVAFAEISLCPATVGWSTCRLMVCRLVVRSIFDNLVVVTSGI